MNHTAHTSSGTPPCCAGVENRRNESQSASTAGNHRSAKNKKRKGIIGRWLSRLASANESEFGKGGPSCCN